MRLEKIEGKFLLTILPRERKIRRNEVSFTVFGVPQELSFHSFFIHFDLIMTLSERQNVLCFIVLVSLSERLLRITESFIKSWVPKIGIQLYLKLNTNCGSITKVFS